MGKNKTVLGKSLIKNQHKKFHQKGPNDFLHTSELADGQDWARLNLRSVTEQSTLDEFLDTAELAGKEFIAEHENIKIVEANNAALPSEAEKTVIADAQIKYKEFLSIPRRPKWDETITAEELDQKEKENFLNWRRQLSNLQEKEHIVLTPYEKTLEFWRQLWRVVERSDIVVQIVDARDPLLFRCDDLEDYVKEVSPDKTNLLLLNKADLLSPRQRNEWAKYFSVKGIKAVFYSALLQSKQKERLSESKDESESDGSESDGESTNVEKPSTEKQSHNVLAELEDLKLGEGNDGILLSKEELTDFWKTYHEGKKVKDGVTTVGLVGYPNVGKSSTINSLLEHKKVSVSATPGKTKHFQTLIFDEELCLCDCPGLVFPSFVSTKADMIINGILPIDQMVDHLSPVALVTSLIPRHVLEETYGLVLSEENEPHEYCTDLQLLNAYGLMRGYMTQRGLPDTARSARYVLKDYVNGKLLYCHAPPTVDRLAFQEFPLPSVRERHLITPAQREILLGDKKSDVDVEKQFFKKANLQAHTKGIPLGRTTDPNAHSTQFKPWKKHNNRNKREKLRRVYAEQDN